MMTKSSWLQYTLVFHEQIQSGSKYWFCSYLIPVLDDKNSYVGYYEIDDIMSFTRLHSWKNKEE
jgi:Mg/Co/Ni transporter MgtE